MTEQGNNNNKLKEKKNTHKKTVKLLVNWQFNREHMVLMVPDDEQLQPYISSLQEHNGGLRLEDKPQ